MGIEDYNISEENMPVHIAIIMDGNGRWAKQRRKPRLFGHNAGMKALHNTVHLASDMGIKILTVYAFSRKLEAQSGRGRRINADRCRIFYEGNRRVAPQPCTGSDHR